MRYQNRAIPPSVNDCRLKYDIPSKQENELFLSWLTNAAKTQSLRCMIQLWQTLSLHLLCTNFTLIWWFLTHEGKSTRPQRIIKWFRSWCTAYLCSWGVPLKAWGTDKWSRMESMHPAVSQMGLMFGPLLSSQSHNLPQFTPRSDYPSLSSRRFITVRTRGTRCLLLQIKHILAHIGTSRQMG